VFQRLVSHNDDIRRLVEKGYAVAFDSNYLIIRDVPYLDNGRRLQTGAIVAKLVFVDKDNVIQDDHQIFFAGSVPHGLDGNPIPNLGGGVTVLALGENCADVVVQRSFSNKPRTATGQFPDFYEKIESYVGIISGPAMELHSANPYTFNAAKDVVSNWERFVSRHAEWLLSRIANFARTPSSPVSLYGRAEYLCHRESARSLVESRLAVFAPVLEVSYGRVSIRAQKTCWGSCSRSGNLNFNYKILFLPAHLQDYVIVHELAHLRELSHSARFWAVVGSVLPSWRSLRRELRGKGML